MDTLDTLLGADFCKLGETVFSHDASSSLYTHRRLCCSLGGLELFLEHAHRLFSRIF